MDPGYSIRHRVTRRGLRVVLDLTATGSGAALARAASRAADEVRELLATPDDAGRIRPDPERRR